MAGEASNVPEPTKLETESEKQVEEVAISDTEPQSPRLTKRIIVITLITSVGSIQYGYYLWMQKHPAALLKEFSNRSHYENKTRHVSENLVSMVNSIHIIIFSLGAIIGCLLIVPLVDRFGRKGGLLINNYLSVLTSGLLGFSPLMQVYEYNFFAHLMAGICTGMFSCIVPLYLGEIAPQKWRGALISVSTLAVSLGLVLSDILGHPSLLGNEKEWPYLLSFNGFLAVFHIFTLPTFPESPRYLLIQRKNERKAMQALQNLRGYENVSREIQQLYQEETADRVECHWNLLKLLMAHSTHWQMLSLLVLVAAQQLTGLKAVLFYADQMSINHWLSESETDIFQILGVLCIFVPLTLVIFVVDRLGRKMLLLMGYGVSGILCVLLVITLEFQTSSSQMAYVSASFLLIFLAAHMMGPGPVTNVLLIELLLQSTRSIGVAVTGILYWLLNFLIGVIFVPAERNFGSFAFFLFLPMCLVGFFYTVKVIPETTDKSFLEIKKCILVSVSHRVQGSRTSQPRKHRRKSSTHSRRRSSLQTGKKKRRKSSVAT